jgi:hypothetical protein
MKRRCYRFAFAADVGWEDVAASMLLGTWAIVSLHGDIAVRLESWQYLDEVGRVVFIDISTDVGRDLARIAYGFFRREFTPQQIQVQPVVIEDTIAAADAAVK